MKIRRLAVLGILPVVVLFFAGAVRADSYQDTKPSTYGSGSTGTDDGASDGAGTTEEQAAGRGPTSGLQEGSQNVDGCRLYVNSTSFGEDCPATYTAGRQTWREILAGQQFPHCKVSPLPPEIVAPVNPKGAEGRWMLHTCLDNVTADGVTPGRKLQRRTELVFYPAGTRIPVFTQAQQTVWNSLVSAYPTPVVAFGPVQPPRVNVASRYWLVPGGDDRARARRATVTTPTGQALDTLTITSVTDATNTPLRAYVSETLLWPGRSPTEPALHCPGAGPVLPAHARPAPGQVCTYTYTRSSAHLPDDMYNITIEAVWAVEYQNAAGAWVPLGQAPVTSVFRTPVHEIQAIAVN